MNRRRLGLIAAAALMLAPAALVPSAQAWAPKASADPVAKALADGRRTTEEVARDARSKPSQVIAFAGVKPGMHVADLVIGTGYYSKIFGALVGPSGKVWAWQPGEFAASNPAYKEPLNYLPPAFPNMTTNGNDFGQFAPPSGLDVAFTNMNYHDFHLSAFPATTAANVNAKVFAALKPGGVYVIIDHYALPGAEPRVSAQTLHRIDPAVVRREVEAAGFVFDGQSDLLRNPADPKTAKVFDPSIYGKTDQFMLRFKKPG